MRPSINGPARPKRAERKTMSKLIKNVTPAAVEVIATENLDALRLALKAAAEKYDAATATKTEMTAAAFLDIVEAKDKAAAAYNAAALESHYDRFLSTDCPVAALARALHWSKLVPVTAKEGGTTLRGRATRFNLLDFIKYAADHEHAIVNGEAIKAAVTAAAETLSAYVLAQVTKEGGMSIAAPKSALEKVLGLIDVDKIHADSKDVRFIAYAVTHARELGELSKITPATVAPFIMDVINAKLNGVKYRFAEEKKEEEAAK